MQHRPSTPETQARHALAHVARAMRRRRQAILAGQPVPSTRVWTASAAAYCTRRGLDPARCRAAHGLALQGLPHHAALCLAWRRAVIDALR